MNTKNKSEPKAIATLTINGLGKMTKKGHRAIAEWLTRLGKDFIKEGSEYSEGRFSARYFAK